MDGPLINFGRERKFRSGQIEYSKYASINMFY